jgi:streptogrisin C
MRNGRVTLSRSAACCEVAGSAEPIVGMSVCHSGNTSYWQCGIVTAVNQTIDYGSVVIEGLATTNACSLGGDSGSAWLAGTKAVGSHSGGQSSCTPGGADDQSIFQPVNEALTKWGLNLVTDSGDTQPPTAPGTPKATATQDSVTLTWDPATDNVRVSGYDVDNGDALATTVTATTATVGRLTPDTSYTFTVKARDAAGNSSPASAPVTVRTQPGSGGRVFGSTTDYPIRDFQVAVSPARATADGRATSPVTVAVTATHTCYEDLNVNLVGPSGRYYALARYGGVSCTPFGGALTYQVAVNENATGTWTLRIGDNGPGDTGVLDAWSVSL